MSSSLFPDHFSSIAASYARFRPTYPAEIFDWIASMAPRREAAWDCGCGSGQATLPLAERFAHVVGTDASDDQLRYAPPRPNVSWKIAPAEASGLEPASMDAVTVAQALHWFDLPRFWDEVHRVLRPRGVIVAWSYGVPYFDDVGLTRTLRHFHDAGVGEYWPIERGHVDLRYESLEFPFTRLDAPRLQLRMIWTLDEMLGYLRTWSATRRYIADKGEDPVTALGEVLAAEWGERRDVLWPLTILGGRA